MNWHRVGSGMLESLRSWKVADILSLLVAIGTLGLTIFTYLLWKETHSAVVEAEAATKIAREALIADRRAWLVPLGARFKGTIELGKPFEVETVYENVGNEPAIVADTYQPYAITGSMSATAGRGPSEVHNTTCQEMAAKTEGLIIYPKMARQYTNLTSLPGDLLTEKILSGEEILYVLGCLTYQTRSVIHHSAYCFYLRPTEDRDINKRQFYSCGTGNYAD